MKLQLAHVCYDKRLGRDMATEPTAIDLTHLTPPEIDTVDADPFGKRAKHRHALFTNSANQIGIDPVFTAETRQGMRESSCRP
jgi:hypothetical protein